MIAHGHEAIAFLDNCSVLSFLRHIQGQMLQKIGEKITYIFWGIYPSLQVYICMISFYPYIETVTVGTDKKWINLPSAILSHP